jgi:K+/H+ antiporter YhaU regulatory subunit KhtT
LQKTSRTINTEWASVSEDSPLVSKTIRDLRLRSEVGVTVTAIIRGDEVLANPGPEVAFEAGDMVGVSGAPDQRAAFWRLVGIP